MKLPSVHKKVLGYKALSESRREKTLSAAQVFELVEKQVRLSRLVISEFSALAEELGLDERQMRVLRYIAAKVADGVYSVQPKEISNALDVSPGHISTAIDALVIRRAVSKTQSSIDRRVIDVRITAVGWKLFYKFSNFGNAWGLYGALAYTHGRRLEERYDHLIDAIEKVKKLRALRLRFRKP